MSGASNAQEQRQPAPADCADDPWVLPSAATELGPGGDPRLYFSVPPYITDGVRRADADSVGHKGLFQQTVARMVALSRCEKTPEHKQTFGAGLRAWFDLDSPTALKPDFSFAQYKQQSPDDGIGLIEVREISCVIDAAQEVGGGTPGFAAWLAALDGWMERSTSGIHAARRGDNHTTFYLATRLALLQATRPTEEARAQAELFLPRLRSLLRTQIAADGAQNRELKRTRPLHYSLFNLEAWASVAGSLEALGLADAAAEIRGRAQTALVYLSDPARLATLEAADREVYSDPRAGEGEVRARIQRIEAALQPGILRASELVCGRYRSG